MNPRFIAAFRIVTLISCILLATSSCSFFRPPRTAKFIKYQIQQGDTLYALGQRFDVTIYDLEDVNDVDDVYRLRVGSVLNIPYHGQSLSKSKTVQATPKKAIGGGSKKWDPNEIKKMQLGDARNEIGRLYWPVKGKGELTSKFGRRWFTFHEGIDLSAPTGTPIYAAHDGVVAYSGSGLNGYGNLIVIRGQRLLSVYAHNDKNRVRRGEAVRRGERIGDVGASGKATGPHLHFEIRIRDKQNKNAAVDPLIFYPQYR